MYTIEHTGDKLVGSVPGDASGSLSTLPCKRLVAIQRASNGICSSSDPKNLVVLGDTTFVRSAPAALFWLWPKDIIRNIEYFPGRRACDPQAFCSRRP